MARKAMETENTQLKADMSKLQAQMELLIKQSAGGQGGKVDDNAKTTGNDANNSADMQELITIGILLIGFWLVWKHDKMDGAH